MVATYEGEGTSATGSTSCTPAYPSGVVAGDAIVALYGAKPWDQSSSAFPSPFQYQYDHLARASSGIVDAGASSGSTIARSGAKEAGSSLSGTITFTATTGPVMVQMLRFSKDSTETWKFEGYPQMDTDESGTSVNANELDIAFNRLPIRPTYYTRMRYGNGQWLYYVSST